MQNAEKEGIIISNASELFLGPVTKYEPIYSKEVPDTIVIKNGLIEAIGETSNILSNYSKFDHEVIDCKKKQIVCPSFVDSHTHLVFAGDRSHELRMKIQGKSYLEIAQGGGGIMFSVNKTREASKSELENSALQRLDEMLLHGTTTIEAKSGYGLDAKTEIKILEVIQEVNEKHPIDIIPTFLGCHMKPVDFLGNQWEYIESMTQLLPQIKGRQLAEYVDIWTDKGAFSVEESQQFLEDAKSFGFKSRVHADELENVGAALMAAELGAVSADHLLYAEAVSASAMAQANVVANLLPATPFVLMLKKYANYQMFKDAGVEVALSSDFNPNCYILNMQLVIGLGCFMMKMLPEEALKAATFGGAKALNRENEIGTLDIGNKADILILDLSSVSSIPYRLGINHANTVFKDGKIVVKDGKKIAN
ncbi:MAG: Imidazolonepropionase [Candidatus Heimdallarchaeota archaeon AB_125]|nr:MAG: Imidazolonepropionase [Candidatus Heimdallarchaeota archaeon AB_125]